MYFGGGPPFRPPPPPEPPAADDTAIVVVVLLVLFSGLPDKKHPWRIDEVLKIKSCKNWFKLKAEESWLKIKDVRPSGKLEYEWPEKEVTPFLYVPISCWSELKWG
jgi:hypothetical protein